MPHHARAGPQYRLTATTGSTGPGSDPVGHTLQPTRLGAMLPWMTDTGDCTADTSPRDGS